MYKHSTQNRVQNNDHKNAWINTEFHQRVRKYKEEPEMKSTITEMNTLEGTISILNDKKEQISKLEDKIVEITEAEQQQKRIKRNEDNLRDC